MTTQQFLSKIENSKINGIEDLYPRQISWDTFAVLSLRNDNPHAYIVDISELSCDCPDEQYNKGDPEICDHIAVTLLAAPVTKKTEEWATREIAEEQRKLYQAIDNVEQTLTAFEADLEDDVPASRSNGSQTSSESSQTTPVDQVRQWLKDQGIPVDQVKIWEHEDYGSINFEADGLDNDDFSRFRDLCQSTDHINWDRNNGVNYVRPDDVERLIA